MYFRIIFSQKYLESDYVRSRLLQIIFICHLFIHNFLKIDNFITKIVVKKVDK